MGRATNIIIIAILATGLDLGVAESTGRASATTATTTHLAQGQLPRGNGQRNRQIRPRPKRSNPSRVRRQNSTTKRTATLSRNKTASSSRWIKVVLAVLLVVVMGLALLAAWIYTHTHPAMDARWLQGLRPSGTKHRTELATRTVMSRPPTTGLRTNTSQMQQRRRA